jgi:dihydrodipicolinate synthase/N-acetylneuraminate lyase
MGVPQGPVRPPLLPLTSDEEGELRSELERLELIGA